MNSRIRKNQDKIIDEFSQLSDWLDTYQYLISLGKKLPPLEDQYKTDETLLNGCQSSVWIYTKQKNNTLQFMADSDSQIIKGLLSLLLRVLNNKQIHEIASADLYFIKEIGLQTHLSPARVNGLLAIINHMKSQANKYDSE